VTLNELGIEVKKLQDLGFGGELIIKSSDDEGNNYSRIDTLEPGYVSTANQYMKLISDEDYDDYEEDELTGVICIW
jgi:hypothetical protein